MPYLPSLLEYEITKYNSQLRLINSNLEKFLLFQKSLDSVIRLHIDVVMERFAEQKNTTKSLQIKDNFEELEKYFEEEELHLSVHLMGDDNDIENEYDYLVTKLSDYVFEKPNWTGTIFVPSEWVEDFETIKLVSNFEVGTWFDLEEYDENSYFVPQKQYLLMTVFAGKSGQKISLEYQELAYKIANNNKLSKFTVDGGWNVNATLSDNLDIVSYTSFWQEFDKVAKLK